jgi:hypothetical protein
VVHDEDHSGADSRDDHEQNCFDEHRAGYFRKRLLIEGFAGDDAEVAKYYPEDQDFLLEFEPTVVHYEVVGHS